MTTTAEATETPIQVERWPSEIPLLIFVALAALFIWLFLALSIFGLIYVLIIGLVLFFVHVMTVTYIRGSAVRLGPGQFPELYERVESLARRAGLEQVPEAYLMEAGGSLNAFATRFFRSRMVVLYSDLLEACGDDRHARDMVIGHELGHLRAGHLNWVWLLAPGLFMPFLGAAYSRAREFTCDRYGAALCGRPQGAMTGLAILAAGGKHGPRVDLRRFVAQSKSLDTGWMTLGKWLSTYPPLCDRVAAIDPGLRDSGSLSIQGPTRAILILASFIAVPTTIGFVVMALVMPKMEKLLEAPAFDQAPAAVFEGDTEAAVEQVSIDFDLLTGFIHSLRLERGGADFSIEEINETWLERYPGSEKPFDPFDGLDYGYYETDTGFVLWSVGPDREINTADDITRPEDWWPEEPE